MSARRARTTLDKARELQRALYRAAKASPTRRFHALYDKMYREDVLAKAWREVRANAGSAGVDGQTIEQIEQQGVEVLLAELATELREGRYRPQAVRRVRIPKPDGTQRGLGIPSVSTYSRFAPDVFGLAGCHPPISPAEGPAAEHSVRTQAPRRASVRVRGRPAGHDRVASCLDEPE